jgi:hypothetical protein
MSLLSEDLIKLGNEIGQEIEEFNNLYGTSCGDILLHRFSESLDLPNEVKLEVKTNKGIMKLIYIARVRRIVAGAPPLEYSEIEGVIGKREAAIALLAMKIYREVNMSNFEDIKIIDWDVNKTRPSDKGSEMRQVYLKLSSTPTQTWRDFFNQSTQLTIDSMKRETWLEGEYIVIDCVPDELEKHHLKNLKKHVQFANENYRKYIEQSNNETEEYALKQKNEKEKLNELKKRLKFD